MGCAFVLLLVLVLDASVTRPFEHVHEHEE